MTRLLLVCLPLLCASVYVQMGIAATHIGCVEPNLALIEHLLLPRALWCDDHRCWSQGSTDLRVHRLECDDDNVCDVKLHCDACVEPALHGIGITLVGVLAVLIFVCVANKQYEPRKHHKL